MCSLETELLEEPLVLTALVLLFQNLLNLLASLLLLLGILQQISGNLTLKGLHIKGVTSGHQVLVVDHLHEGLDANTTGNLLGTHGLGDGQRGTLNTEDESTGKLLTRGLVTLIEMYKTKEEMGLDI